MLNERIRWRGQSSVGTGPRLGQGRGRSRSITASAFGRIADSPRMLIDDDDHAECEWRGNIWLKKSRWTDLTSKISSLRHISERVYRTPSSPSRWQPSRHSVETSSGGYFTDISLDLYQLC